MNYKKCSTMILTILFINIGNAQTFERYCLENEIKTECEKILNTPISSFITFYADKPYVKVTNSSLSESVLYNYVKKKIITKAYSEILRIGDSNNFIIDTKKKYSNTKAKTNRFAYLKNMKEEIFIDCESLRTSTKKNEVIIKKDNHFGLLDSALNILISPIYDDMDYARDVFEVLRNGKRGLIDRNGNILVELKYDYFHWSDSFVGVIKSRNVNNYYPPPEIAKSPPVPEVAESTLVNNEKVIDKKGDRYDVYNSRFEKIMSKNHVIKFSGSHDLYQFERTLKNDTTFWETYNSTGEKLFDCHLKNGATHFPKKRIFRIMPLGEKFGLMNYNGDIVLPFIYDRISISEFNDFCIAKIDKKNRLIDFHNKVIFETDKYDLILDNGYGLIKAKYNGNFGYIDYTGKVVIPFEYKDVESFKDKVNVVWKNGKCGLIDTKNNILIPFKYENPALYDDFVILRIRKDRREKGTKFFFDFQGNSLDCQN